MYDKNSLSALKELALEALSTLKVSFDFSQDELENYLKPKNQLFVLSYSFDESFMRT